MFSRNFKGPRHSKTTRDYSSDDSLSETERQAIHIELEEMTLHPQGRAGAVGRVQPCRGAKRKAQKSIDKAYLKEKVWRDAQEVLRISKRRKMTELTERGLSTSGRGKGREIIDSQSRSDIGHSFKMLIHGNTGRRGMNSGEGEEGIRQAEGVEGDSETHHEDCGEVSSQESRLCDDSVQEDGEGLQGEGEGETSASDDNDGSEDRSELPASDDLTENVSEDVDDHSSTSQDGPSCIDIQDESDGCKEQDGHETDEGEMSNGDGSNPSHDETSSSSLSNLPENQTEEEPAESQDSGGPDVSQSQILTDGMLLPIEDPTVKGEDQVRDRCIICFNNLETIRCNSVRNDLDPILVIWTCNQCQTEYCIDCTLTWVTSNCPKRRIQLKRNARCPVCRCRWSSFDILEQARTYNPVLYDLSY